MILSSNKLHLNFVSLFELQLGWSFPTSPTERQILLESKGRIVGSNQKIHTQEHQDEPKRYTAMEPGKSSTKIEALRIFKSCSQESTQFNHTARILISSSTYQHESLDHQRALKGDSRPSMSWTLQGTCYWSPDPSVVVQKVEESESPLRTQNVPRHVWMCASHTSLAPNHTTIEKCVPCIVWGGEVANDL